MAENPTHGELNIDPSKTVTGIASRIRKLVLKLKAIRPGYGLVMFPSNEKKMKKVRRRLFSLSVSGEKPKHGDERESKRS